MTASTRVRTPGALTRPAPPRTRRSPSRPPPCSRPSTRWNGSSTAPARPWSPPRPPRSSRPSPRRRLAAVPLLASPGSTASGHRQRRRG
ncbi:hypothetical protein QJS66_15915 [Kocuria rhizophila]|nr:hypothetical protein QJS66_15915 [Kocuria rhizophila]